MLKNGQVWKEHSLENPDVAENAKRKHAEKRKREKQEKPNTVVRKKPDAEKDAAGTRDIFFKIELKKN